SRFEEHPPLYYVLLWLWSGLTGTSEFALRIFSLCFATLALALSGPLYRTLSRVFVGDAHQVSMLALMLLALSPSLALYGVMLRYYSFVLCLATLLTLLFAAWLRRAADPRLITDKQ